MIKYRKESTRLPVQFIDSETEEILFTVNNRNVTDIGEVYSDAVASSIIGSEFKGNESNLPDKILIMTVVELTRV